MAHHLELLMPPEWPDNHTRRISHTELADDGAWLDLYWPVPALPPEMGFLQDAQLIPGDPEGCYYALVNVGFFDDYITFHMPYKDDGAEHEVSLSYSELAYLTRDPLLRIYRDFEFDVPFGMTPPTRRFSGFVRISEGPPSPTTSKGARRL